jgi:hypothetical protein
MVEPGIISRDGGSSPFDPTPPWSMDQGDYFSPSAMHIIPYDTFAAVDLRVGRIREVEDTVPPGSKVF